MARVGEEAEGKFFVEQTDALTQQHNEPEGAKKDTQEPDVCKFYQMGRCHFGDRCRLSHSAHESASSKPLPTEEKDTKSRKTRKKSGKSEKAAEEERNEPEKKPRMRTADDVISRILWDSSVDASDFIVGHLDRFLGVLERPFSDFAWDTQVCDCDYSEEMSIPRHRIHYFSYKGQRVWDKDSRTDLVFGSTGQKVVPPFDKQAQPQGNEAPNTGRDAKEVSVEKNERDDSEERRQTGTADERTVNEAGEMADSNTSSPQDSDLANEAERLSMSQKNERFAGDWKDLLNKDDVEMEEAAEEKTETTLAIPQEPRPGRQPRRPTHFICFRVDTPAALLAFQRVQRKVLSHLPESEPYWTSPASLHVTLSLLVLQNPEEVCAAAELLRSIVKSIYKPPISVLFNPKLKHFNGRVLHLPPQPLSDIQSLNSPIQQAFWEKGWLHRHSRCPTYHLTLAKVSDGVTDRIFNDVGAIKLAKDVNFGKLEVEKLYMCVNNLPKTESGFYQTICTVQLPSP